MSLQLNFHLARGAFELCANAELSATGITGISGPSGSGKTSLLRAVAGLETVNGELLWRQQSLNTLAAHQRPFGYVFQEPRLFPHLSVKQNLMFAAQRADKPLPLDALTAQLGLTELLHRKPAALSGGQAQRAALARAVIGRPQLLLLDEPLANLDAAAKRELLAQIAQINRDYALPMLYVSHAKEELAELCEQVLLVERNGSHSAAQRLLPTQQALTDASSALCGGDDPLSVLQARYIGFDAAYGLSEFALDQQMFWLAQPPLPSDAIIKLAIHARDVSISLTADAASSIQNRLRAEIIEIRYREQAHCDVLLAVDGQLLLARITRRAVDQLQLQPKQTVYAQVKAAAMA